MPTKQRAEATRRRPRTSSSATIAVGQPTSSFARTGRHHCKLANVLVLCGHRSASERRPMSLPVVSGAVRPMSPSVASEQRPKRLLAADEESHRTRTLTALRRSRRTRSSAGVCSGRRRTSVEPPRSWRTRVEEFCLPALLGADKNVDQPALTADEEFGRQLLAAHEEFGCSRRTNSSSVRRERASGGQTLRLLQAARGSHRPCRP